MRETQSRTGLAVRTFTPGRASDRPTVLLVHGFGSDGHQDWVATGIAPALAEAGQAVIVPDLRGHGDSPAPSAAGEAGATALVADLLAVLDEAGAGTFDAIGYSLGARLAWELPTAAPGRLRRTVLGGLSPAEPFEAVEVAALHRAVADGTEPADPFTAMIAGMVRAHGDRAAGLALCVEGLRGTPFAPRSWTGDTPPVFVVGKDDMMTRGIERVVDLVEGADLVTVPGEHHEVLAGAAFRRTVLEALTG
ncbi:alpha/beta fold hydrolase [Streptomyces sp. p1417]|uniref:Alpha/beta fold hydrolase n=1 Tax=Streptomyces typhae TaxID=2681492 RepID=A0A6L6XAQ6_9ACTN|nr:alpha/beta hydrolase [Streptomyces typhae]MVO90550.1 alpha/beta fold hydrolase [Streptomyces typhae]